jgi:hypothetical protein
MRVQVFSIGFVEMKRSAVQRVAKCQAEKLCCSCLQPLIPGQRVVRGCHLNCAKATYRAIEAGKLTDDGQVEAGEWLPRENGGRKPTIPVSKKASSAS